MFSSSTKLIVANWKMNPDSLDHGKKIISGVKRLMSKVKNVEIVVCPPALFFGDIRGKTPEKKKQKLSFGVQNMYHLESGPYTGEYSPSMARSAGAKYVIIGHSERRALGETNDIVATKVELALKWGLTPIICVGEQKDEHDSFMTELPIQIKTALSKIKPIDVPLVVIAYEPVYAIGASKPVSGYEVHQRNIFIKKVLTEMIGKERAFKVKVLYGGSVDVEGTADLVETGVVDGLLIGRASLDPKGFMEIAKRAGNVGVMTSKSKSKAR